MSNNCLLIAFDSFSYFIQFIKLYKLSLVLLLWQHNQIFLHNILDFCCVKIGNCNIKISIQGTRNNKLLCVVY